MLGVTACNLGYCRYFDQFLPQKGKFIAPAAVLKLEQVQHVTAVSKSF